MSGYCRILCLTVAFALAVLLLIGASCASSAPSAPSEPQYPDNSLDLSDANEQTLAEVGDRYAALAAGGSAPLAAAALLAELQAGRAGVSSAALGSDGYTIFLTLSDGSPALINTNTAAFGSAGDTQAAATADSVQSDRLTARKAISQRTAFAIPASFTCPGRVVPSTHKALIVNAAAISHPSTNGYVTQLQDALIAQGWQQGDIDVRTRQGAENDHAFTPTSMTDIGGYGLVFIIAQGSLLDPGDGVRHVYLQCCRVGSILDVMQPEQWLTVSGERNDGRLIRSQTVAENGSLVKDTYARDDFLVQQMSIDAGALVYFIAPNSWSVANGLGGQGAGSAMGWEGSFTGDAGQRTVLGMLRQMTADNAWTTDEQAFESITGAGLGTSGETASARLAAIAGDFYLPAWAEFSVDPEKFPKGATQAKVDVSYAACPGGSLDFTMGASDTRDAGYFPAGEATVTVDALNAAGDVVGSGLQTVPVNGGRNEIKLATCKGTAKLQLTQHPDEGENATAKIRLEFIYPSTMSDAPKPVEINIADVNQWSEEIPAGKIQVHGTALNATGQVVGERTKDVNIECDISPIGMCFGWVKLESGQVTSNTASIRVTSNSSRAPGPFTLQPGGSTKAYGFNIGETVHFAAEAQNASGSVIASASQAVTIACGENTAAFDLANYGISVTAQPTQIAADGQASSTITAALRLWQAGDTTAPSGDPVAGKSVQFSTTLGTLAGTNPATTDEHGQAVIQLSGAQPGAATVVAFVKDDQKQGMVSVAIGTPSSDLVIDTCYYTDNETAGAYDGLITTRIAHPDFYRSGAAGATVHYSLLTGSVEFAGPADQVTSDFGFGSLGVRSDKPTVALIEVTVPGTTLVKHCLVYFGLVMSVSPTTAQVEVDNGEMIVTASVNPDPAGLGLPKGSIAGGSTSKYRPTRGGTASVAANCETDAIPGTYSFRIWRASEPDTAIAFSLRPSWLVDGGWVDAGVAGGCDIEFYQVGSTVGIKIDSHTDKIENPGFPTTYTGSVIAHFTWQSSAGGNRYIVSNPLDHGQAGVDMNWQDGFNSGLSGSDGKYELVVAGDSTSSTSPVDGWVAAKVQEFQAKYGQLSIKVSNMP